MRTISYLTAAAIVPVTLSMAAAEDLTIVSWGGAYSASQQKAYHDPYMAENPEVRIIKTSRRTRRWPSCGR